MSGEFHSRKDLNSKNLNNGLEYWQSYVLESCVVQGLLVYILLIIWSEFIKLKTAQKEKGGLRVDGTPILEVILVNLTENLSVVINDTQGPRKCSHHSK